MTPMKWFFSFLKKYRKFMLIGLFLTMIVSVLSIVNPYVSGEIVDKVIRGGDQSLLLPLLGCLLGTTIAISIIRYLFQFLFETASQGVLYDMRDKVYRKLLEEDFAFYNKKRTGDLMSRQTGDMDAIRHFVAYVIYMVCQNVLMFVFALIMIFTVNVKLALCMVIVLPFTALTTILQSKEVHPAFKRTRDCFSSLNALVQENVSGNRVVKAFAKEDYEIQKFEEENNKFRSAQVSASRVWMKYVPIFEVLSYVLTIILILYGGSMVIHEEITLGQLVVVNGYLWMLNVPLRMAGWLVNDISNFITSVDKVYKTYVEEPTIKTPMVAAVRDHIKGGVEFKQVSYRADDEDIVMDINFKVEPGQTVGIIGSTGSGKSTIMNLLCRFYDTTSGDVLVDGVNVKDIDLYYLRDNIGMAMQDVFLFSDTIEGNIAYGRPESTFDEVKKAAIMADADEFIMALPEGYDTIVGERGVGLSGGQKQRISLARALIKDPSILILDDTTSAVDMETESFIQKQLKSMKTCTTFIIAYRISSIKDSDLILVLDHGRIVEQGTHEQLVDAGGYYASAFRNQYGEIPKTILLKKGGK